MYLPPRVRSTRLKSRHAQRPATTNRIAATNRTATKNRTPATNITANGIKTYSMSGLRKLAVENFPEQIRAPYQLAQLLQLAGIVRLGNP